MPPKSWAQLVLPRPDQAKHRAIFSCITIPLYGSTHFKFLVISFDNFSNLEFSGCSHLLSRKSTDNHRRPCINNHFGPFTNFAFFFWFFATHTDSNISLQQLMLLTRFTGRLHWLIGLKWWKIKKKIIVNDSKIDRVHFSHAEIRAKDFPSLILILIPGMVLSLSTSVDGLELRLFFSWFLFANKLCPKCCYVIEVAGTWSFSC